MTKIFEKNINYLIDELLVLLEMYFEIFIFKTRFNYNLFNGRDN